MTILHSPSLDDRSAQQLFNYLSQRLNIASDGTDPLGEALLRIFSRYSEIIIERLNQVPEKHYHAFLDLLKISPLPPVSARVPLTFTPVKQLPKGARQIVVPACTQVAAMPGPSESEPTVFETTKTVALTNATLEHLFTMNPEEDRYSDLTHLLNEEQTEGALLFTGDRAVEHELFIGHSQVFALEGLNELTVAIELENDAPVLSDGLRIEWQIATLQGEVVITPLRDTTQQLTRSGEIVFGGLPKWPTHTLFSRETCWLKSCLMLNGKSGLPAVKFPQIQSVSLAATSQVDEATIEQGFNNTFPLDLSKDFFPLGERPRFGDVFYLNSSVLSRPNSHITLSVTLTNPASAGGMSPLPAVSKDGRPRVQWECWNGIHWVVLDVSDETEALTENGQISFQLPPDFQQSTINGLENYWVRVRLVAGNYGETDREGLPVLPPPAPAIQNVTITSSGVWGPYKPDVVVAHNNRAYEEIGIDNNPRFAPFRIVATQPKALYLGLGTAENAGETFSDRSFNFYFHFSSASERPYIRARAEREAMQLTWQYWGGTDWQDANVEDETEALTRSGAVSINVGEGFAKWKESAADPTLYWLRVLWVAGEREDPPKLQRVSINTVTAKQAITLRNELLGSSTGLPNQTFNLARFPVAGEVCLEVREPGLPTAKEREQIILQEGKDAVKEIRNARGEVEQTWIRWHEVNDFLLSGSCDRHFVINRLTGEVVFGNGTNGLIPPIGSNNVRIARYQTGGGEAGNKPKASVSQLRTTVPYVDSVTNEYDAVGGIDLERMESVHERGSRWLRHRERAITEQDFEDLAKLADPTVAMTKCFSARDLASDPLGSTPRPGIVSLIVVPRDTNPRPRPNRELLERVQTFLDRRRLPNVGLVLVGPEYVRVSVSVRIVRIHGTLIGELADQAEQKLAEFLHPIIGGADGTGWSFGQLPKESDFYALLGTIPGLDYVRVLSIETEDERTGLEAGATFLVCSGRHTVRIDTYR